MKVYILMRDDVPRINTTSITNWFLFHDLQPTVVKYQDKITLDGDTVIVTDDMIPTAEFVKAVVRKEYVCSSITYHPNSNNQWRPTYLIYFKQNTPMETTVEDAVTGTMSHIVEHRDGLLDYPDVKRSSKVWQLNLKMAQTHNLDSKYLLLTEVLPVYWYDVCNDVVSRYYLHVTILAYQKRCLASRSIYGVVDKNKEGTFDWLMGQCSFLSKVSENPSDLSFVEACKLTTLEATLPLGRGYRSFRISSDLSRTELDKHPLTLPGMYRVHSTKVESDYDTSRTIVGFFYDMGISIKPKEHYHNSIRKWCTFKHPLVFYGNQESCDLVMKYRNPAFTQVVVGQPEDWDLIRDHLEEFRVIGEPNVIINQQKRYSLITNLKVEVMNRTAKANYFNSDILCWVDVGFFKHEHIGSGFRLDEPTFSKLPVVDDKITIHGITDTFSSTHDELLNSKERFFSYIMGATLETWQRFHTINDKFIRSMFSEGIFRTEQIMHTRLATLRPELFNIVHGNCTHKNACLFDDDED